MEPDEESQHPNNALMFRRAISNSFKHIAECVSEEEFHQTFTILKEKSKVAQKLHKAMIQELYKSMSDDLEDILNEGSIQEALTKVCKLSENADVSMDQEVWRPPGNVALHLRSLDAEKIKKESEQLEKRVTALEGENALLMKEIAEKRPKVHAALDRLTRSVNHSSIATKRVTTRLEQLDKCIKLMNQS